MYVYLFCSCASDLEKISKVRVNTEAVLKRAQYIQGQTTPKKQWQVELFFQLHPVCFILYMLGHDEVQYGT